MRKALLLMVAGTAAVLSGCGKSDSTPTTAAAPPPAPVADLIFTDGWAKIDIYANFAHTSIDSGAHFNTDRNQCGFDAYGALDIKVWNALAKDVNTFMKSSRLPQEKCRDLSDADYHAYKFDGTADLVLPDGTSKMMLFETRSWSVCSLIEDDGLHQRILKAVNDVVVAADKEDCDHSPWGGLTRVF